MSSDRDQRVRKLRKAKAQVCCLRLYFHLQPRQCLMGSQEGWVPSCHERTGRLRAHACPCDANPLTGYASAVTGSHCLLLSWPLFLVLPSGTSLTSWS